MNILLLAEVSAERVLGGAERVLRNQALGLAMMGHHVELLTRAPEHVSEGMLEMNGIREWRYSVSRKHEAAFLWSSVRRSVEQFDHLRATEPLDAVVIHQSLAGLGPILARRHAASRWIYICHSLAHEEYETRQGATCSTLASLRRQANLRARRSVERAVMSRCHKVAVLSQFMRQRVIGAHDISVDRLALIPGAVDPHAFMPLEDRLSIKAALNLPTNRTILFTVRNLVPRMGLDNLLCAIEMLNRAQHKLMLVIGGEGPLHEQLQADIRRKRLRDVVRLIGFVPESQLSRYYQAADLVLMPSLQLEGFGLVMVEAMACGTPVLGTPVGAIPEILNQVDPILVAEGVDGRSIGRALERVLRRLQEPGEANRLANKGRALIERRYNWKQHCNELLGLLDGPRQLRLAA
ncbi:MAG TPA: glycosyltransferase family 4 protein [Nitrospira sp.]|nr:glycosyltransferase family 4 protein [Nitrospira sp.]